MAREKTSAKAAGAAERFEQRRGGRKARFTLEAGALAYAFEDRDGSSFSRRIAWEDLSPPIDHIETQEGDAALGWVLMTIPLLALFGVFRGQPQPLGFGLAVAFGVVLVAGALATRRMRLRAATTIPSPEGGVVVLADAQRDAILAAIEAKRVAALIADHGGADDETARAKLRRLRWLSEQGAISADVFEAERAQLIGPGPRRAPQPNVTLERRVFGESVTFEFRDDHVVHTSRSLFGGMRRVRLMYRKLVTPGSDVFADVDWRLAIATLGWVGAAILSWMAAISQKMPADYYVGGPGLPRALADYGPAFLLLVIAVVLIERWTKRRYTELYPNTMLIEGKGADAIRDELERRRIEALRRLAEPDPLIDAQERRALFAALERHGAVDAAERDALIGAGDAAEDAASGLDTVETAPSRARMLH